MVHGVGPRRFREARRREPEPLAPPELAEDVVVLVEVERARRPGAAHDEQSETRRRELRSAVADMLREREALRSRLDALAREREHLEDLVGGVQQVSSKPQRRHQGPADRTTRIWCGTIRLHQNDDLGAACAAALPVGTKDEVERAAGFDVVVAALASLGSIENRSLNPELSSELGTVARAAMDAALDAYERAGLRHDDAARWRCEGPRSEAEASQLVAAVQTAIEALES